MRVARSEKIPRWLVLGLVVAFSVVDVTTAPGGMVINFENAGAPCVFANTVALRNEYAELGVVFASGTGANDGFAVLNQCANFGVTGFSPPNFLAWNENALYLNGGIPRGPEVILFSPAVTSVQINAGSGISSGQVTMEAFNVMGASLGSTSIALQPAMQTLQISASGIAKVVITVPVGSAGALDDLAFVESSTGIPTLSQWGLVGMVSLLMGVAVLAMRRRLSPRRINRAA